MKKIRILAALGLLSAGLFACGGDKTPPLSDRLRKVWTVRVAQENGTVVYTKGGASNTRPAYANFRLDLSNTQAQTARLTETDNTTFVGAWALSSDEKKLVLNGLTPQPTGTIGTVEYLIEGEVTEAQLTLSRTTANLKTGGTINRYELTSP